MAGRRTAEYEAKRQIALRMYPDHTPAEIFAVVNVDPKTLRSWAIKAGVKRSEETQQRINDAQTHRLLTMAVPASIGESMREKRSRIVHTKWEISRKRVYAGEKPMNGYRPRMYPIKVNRARYVLKKRGYIATDSPFLYLYTSSTRRLQSTHKDKGEKIYTKNYGIKFHMGRTVKLSSLKKRYL